MKNLDLESPWSVLETLDLNNFKLIKTLDNYFQ